MKFSKWIGGAFLGLMMLGFAATQVQAQTPLSFVAGPTFYSLYGDDVDSDNVSSKTGFFFAVGTAFELSEGLMLEPYLGYMQKGTKNPDGDEEFSVDYISVPVFLNKSFPAGESASFSISGGPHIGFNIGCDFDGEDCSDDDDFKKLELGVMGAAGVGFPVGDSGGLAIGGGVDFGLTSLYDNESVKNKGFFVFLAFNTAVGG